MASHRLHIEQGWPSTPRAEPERLDGGLGPSSVPKNLQVYRDERTPFIQSAGCSNQSQPPSYSATGPPDGSGWRGTTAVTTQPNKTGIGFLALAFLLMFISWASTGYLRSHDILDPVVRDKIRADWKREYERHQAQVSKMQEIETRWASEVAEHSAARRSMVRERATWEAERKEWREECAERERIRRAEREFELERQRREEGKRREEEEDAKRRSGVQWADVTPDKHCLRWGTRMWTSSRLENLPYGYDPIKACSTTKALIHGKWVLPDTCQSKAGWGGVVGTWYIDFDEAGCYSFWNEFKDKGCTAQGSGKRMIESRLENIRPGDDAMVMCSSTPARFNGLEFDGPHSCNYRGRHGYWGIWFIDDGSC
ncbi:hypothetical protein CC1G_05795 [Coprinopsis cinerea okayama7|uniref:Uncharacterized protein n=1 Tax=Coprinopsis cinerea (strain Okayama-7 / 130 / ATCC MYA-4618 / FGSC 9003) TaxID=240176 RepID=A8NLD3_COPC7|nr:hypothetical protein CC1G_05795 [Coprinopsis cinerea okayama7\|eukprot:XP_001834658.1 hypothetical protein CC1G_05795 [Coprinopsis cinerea okayama7\